MEYTILCKGTEKVLELSVNNIISMGGKVVSGPLINREGFWCQAIMLPKPLPGLDEALNILAKPQFQKYSNPRIRPADAVVLMHSDGVAAEDIYTFESAIISKDKNVWVRDAANEVNKVGNKLNEVLRSAELHAQQMAEARAARVAAAAAKAAANEEEAKTKTKQGWWSRKTGGGRRSVRRSGATRKAQRGGAGLRVYYGKVLDASGNVVEKNKNAGDANVYFSKGNNRGFNSYWHDINTALSAHAKKHFTEAEIVSEGFGGDDGSGTVVVRCKKSLPPMEFAVGGKQYKMVFDRFENNNNV